jgi:hypothetical protein
MAEIQSAHGSLTNFLQAIDDDAMKDLMQYFHLEDYDELLRYAITLGVSLMSKK